ncbi:hypothetical protein CAPTEDRAFT_128278 [Capitella teleta]|uniref:Uncharacterized protein n=1 Tax=Capitella teleta TaxID=283909 RepID=R7U4A1_CAPTE|nr:hypothetical protein CAPTEDRAFT_128278 [Capitella teleta]|eukprot:ELT98511.1 hypothetical protein CAPTEDRAFT_128278 [Capitella teleta]
MDRERGHLPRDVSLASSSLNWVKLVGLGNLSVGKTCLIKHFCESKFSSGYQPTVGVDYGFKIQNVAGLDLRVHLWDLSGGAEFLDVRNELYGETDAIFIVFDVTNKSSFDAAEAWLREISKYGPPNAFVYLVGNKSDLKSKRILSAAEAKKWATRQQMTYFETSCLNGDGVESMFSSILEAIAKQRGLV